MIGFVGRREREIYNLITPCYEVITMFWDFFDDDFWDLDLEDFAITGAVAGLIEEEEEENLRRQLEEDSDEDSHL